MVHELTRDEKAAHGFTPNQVVIWVEGKPVLFELEETSIDLRTGKMENKYGPCSGGHHKECKGIGCSCSHKMM